MRWRMLAVVTLAQVTASFATQGLGALSGAVHDAFALSGAEVGLMVTAVGLAPVFSLFVVGHLVDRHGERWVVAIGSLVMTAGLAATSMAPGYAVVLASLFFAGVGYSTVQPGGGKSVTSWFPAGRRGVAMGVRQAGLPIGGAAAAAVLPGAAHALGWQAAFAVAAAVALAGGVVFTLAYRPPPDTARRTRPEPGDHVRQTRREPRHRVRRKQPEPRDHVRRTRREQPDDARLLPGLARTLRRPWLRPVLWSGVPLVGAQFCLTAHLMLFTRDHFHRPLSQGAVLLALLQAGGVTGRVLLAYLSDHTRGSRLSAVRISMLCSALFLALLPVLPARTPFGVLAAVTAALGFFVIGWYGPWVAHIADAAPDDSVGRAMGAAMGANQVAIVAAPPLLGLLHDSSGSYLITWWLPAATLTACALRTAQPDACPVATTRP
ncbi:MFS transporter [Streptomyces sp. NPDC001339]|uniref:MFS transporter n=1 Tax=Streptomyces sp. NPDC001339 TaxID=3364563 RepID=UPI0036892108